MYLDLSWRPVDTPETHGFWSRVDVGESWACWPYVGRYSTGKGGHARITHAGERNYAHRVAYSLAGGSLDDGPMILHTPCDWGLCCNPRHLMAGDALLNARHRDLRGRRTPYLARGSEAPVAKLTERDVIAIVTGKRNGVPADVLASMYAVSRRTIFNLLSGRHYSREVSLALTDAGFASLLRTAPAAAT